MNSKCLCCLFAVTLAGLLVTASALRADEPAPQSRPVIRAMHELLNTKGTDDRPAPNVVFGETGQSVFVVVAIRKHGDVDDGLERSIAEAKARALLAQHPDVVNQCKQQLLQDVQGCFGQDAAWIRDTAFANAETIRKTIEQTMAGGVIVKVDQQFVATRSSRVVSGVMVDRDEQVRVMMPSVRAAYVRVVAAALCLEAQSVAARTIMNVMQNVPDGWRQYAVGFVLLFLLP
ncbi:MAG: hypothetical protein R3E01_35050 [Pirellulaceae bacterium]|nr:hypothetical protein [Planctomycetales bacterium]